MKKKVNRRDYVLATKDDSWEERAAALAALREFREVFTVTTSHQHN